MQKTLPRKSQWQALSYEQRIIRFRDMRERGMVDFDSGMTSSNQRRAHCRVCLKSFDKGEMVGYIEFMSDGYNCLTRYICAFCKAVTD